MVRFKMNATAIAAVNPSAYAPVKTSDARQALCANNSAASMLYTGIRAEQVTSGMTRIVTSRSRLSSITRVAMIDGIAQAWADSNGTNALPGRPNFCISRSITNAARAR